MSGRELNEWMESGEERWITQSMLLYCCMLFIMLVFLHDTCISAGFVFAALPAPDRFKAADG